MINLILYYRGFENKFQKNAIEFFLKNYFFRKRKIIFFSKGNKMKGGNKDALQSGRDRYTAKNYITTRIFPLIPFFFNVINGLI